MDVPDPNTDPVEIVCQLLGHPLGEGCDKDPLVILRPLADLFHQVVHLVFRRSNLNRRIQKPGRTYNLLYHKTFRAIQLIIGRSGADIYLLPGDLVELVELQRAVVRRGREPEAIFNQNRLAGVVTSVHGPYLGDGDVALVDESDKVVREVVDQAERPLSWLAAVQIPGVVLDPGAVSHLLDHLKIVLNPLLQAFGFQSLANVVEVVDLSLEIVLDHADRLDAPFPGRDEIGGGEYRHFVQVLDPCPGDGVDQRQGFHLVPEELYPDSLVGTSKEHIHSVAAHSERASLEIHFRPAVVGVHEMV